MRNYPVAVPIINPSTEETLGGSGMHIKDYLLFLFGMIAAVGMTMGGRHAMAIEEAPFAVMEKSDNFELREYPSYIVAETYVEGNFEKVGNEGFRRLAGYIKGKNRKTASIAMTAPVSQEAGSEKIAMTAPVGQEREGNRWRITFMMPSQYTLETLPRPDDERITLTEEPSKLLAAIRYSGTWGRKRYEDHEAKLIGWIDDKGWKQIGAPVWARYNPPFMPWFLRRNEILIPVEIE
jgi:hypothetical protein